jgi:hypothetical protein
MGQVWRLPDGKLVLIEQAENGLVAGRRIDGIRQTPLLFARLPKFGPNNLFISKTVTVAHQFPYISDPLRGGDAV